MAVIFWSNDYKVNIEKIDNQHEQMVEYINSLYDAMLNKKAERILEEILERLTIYSVNHFQTEERMMIEHSYPDYALHKKEHSLFIVKIRELKEKNKNARGSISLELTQYLKNWLLSHIANSDKIMAKYFIEKPKIQQSNN